MNRAELARQAWAILLSSPNLRNDFEANWIAECAVKAADELLAKLNITPETVAESQQVRAGIARMRYVGPERDDITVGETYLGIIACGEFLFKDDGGDSRYKSLKEFENA